MPLLITQLIVFTIYLLFMKWRYKNWYYYRSIAVSMGAVLIMGAIGHILYLEGMQLMFPEWVPFKKPVVILSGMYECLLAYAFFHPRRRETAAKICIAYLIITLPFNIYASLHYVNHVNADYSGEGPVYLWFRIPLQLFWIGCCYLIYKWKPIPIYK